MSNLMKPRNVKVVEFEQRFLQTNDVKIVGNGFGERLSCI